MLALKLLGTLLLLQQAAICFGQKKFDGIILKMVKEMLENQQETVIKESNEVNSNDKLSIVQNNIIGIQKNVKNLQHDLNNTEEIKVLKELNEELDKELLKNLRVLHSYNDALKNLTGCYSTITVIMNKLLIDLEESERTNKDESLIKQCVHYIRDGDYKKAVDKLYLIYDENKIYDIVDYVYKFEIADSFEKVLKFAEKIRTVGKSFTTYKALLKQMELYGDNDAYHYLAFVKSLETEIIDQTTRSEMVKDSKQLLKLVKDKLKLAGKEDLKKRVLYDSNYLSHNYSHDEVPEKIFKCDKKLYNKMFWEFLNDMYKSDLASLSQLIEFNYGRGNSVQKVIGFSLILDLMKDNDDINNKEVIQLANYLKLTLNKGEIKADDHHTKDELIIIFSQIQEKLPSSVKNLVFAKKVCLKNVGYNEYLYAAGIKTDDYNFKTKESRYVFTWRPKHDGNEHKVWYMEHTSDDLYKIKNIYHNEYLYPDKAYNGENRHVFTWIPGTEKSDAIWEIIPEGDHCYIKSTAYKEYFYGSTILYDSDRRYSFTWTSKTMSTHLPHNGDALWVIEDCAKIK